RSDPGPHGAWPPSTPRRNGGADAAAKAPTFEAAADTVMTEAKSTWCTEPPAIPPLWSTPPKSAAQAISAPVPAGATPTIGIPTVALALPNILNLLQPYRISCSRADRRGSNHQSTGGRRG